MEKPFNLSKPGKFCTYRFFLLNPNSILETCHVVCISHINEKRHFEKNSFFKKQLTMNNETMALGIDISMY